MAVEVVKGLDLRMGDRGWDWASSHRARISAHWSGLAARNPAWWNGEVLICTKAQVAGGILQGRFAATDYASFLAWRDWGWPDRSVCNCFGSAVVITSDGALVFGVMAEKTANAGRIYPPGGSLEPRDVLADGSIDITGSMLHEVAEETGLDISAAGRGGRLAVFDGSRLAVVQAFHVPEKFSGVQQIFASHAATGKNDELAGLAAIRSASQIVPAMPGFAQEIVRRFLP